MPSHKKPKSSSQPLPIKVSSVSVSGSCSQRVQNNKNDQSNQVDNSGSSSSVPGTKRRHQQGVEQNQDDGRQILVHEPKRSKLMTQCSNSSGEPISTDPPRRLPLQTSTDHPPRSPTSNLTPLNDNVNDEDDDTVSDCESQISDVFSKACSVSEGSPSGSDVTRDSQFTPGIYHYIVSTPENDRNHEFRTPTPKYHSYAPNNHTQRHGQVPTAGHAISLPPHSSRESRPRSSQDFDSRSGFFHLSQSQNSLTVLHAPNNNNNNNAALFDGFNILRMPQLTPMSPLVPSTSRQETGQSSSEVVKLRNQPGSSKNLSVQDKSKRFGMYITTRSETISVTMSSTAPPCQNQQQQPLQNPRQCTKRPHPCKKQATPPSKVPRGSQSSSSSSGDGSPAQFIASSSHGWERQRLSEVSPAIRQDPRVMEIRSPKRASRPKSLLSLKKFFKKK